MSFSSFTPATAKADFDAAVDATVPSPALTTDEAKALFSKGQVAAKALASDFDGNGFVQASISGHACQEESDWPYDSITVSVTEVAPPPAPEPDPAASTATDAPAPEPTAEVPAPAAEGDVPGSSASVADAEFGKL